MGAVRELCGTGILLGNGRIKSIGSAEELIQQYLLAGSSSTGKIDFHTSVEKKQKACIRSFAVKNKHDEATCSLDVKKDFFIELKYCLKETLPKLEIGLRVATSDGRPIFTSLLSEAIQENKEIRKPGEYQVKIKIPGEFLMPGFYIIQNIALFEPHGEIYDSYNDVMRLDIQDTGTVFTKYNNNPGIGLVMKKCGWEIASSPI
jgi:lipopolysaccharide transport system ATP-binding protein